MTEAVQFFDGKLYGATQVMDEGRHVEVFHRYLDEKLDKLYQINDNLFVIIDALMTDSRWDMKFLGMQIMVEGLALGAFGTLYKLTKEPLLKQLLKMVIQDEARHVHYGVLALREHITKELSESERREREDWAFEVALLMRNRFIAYEVYEELLRGRHLARAVAGLRAAHAGPGGVPRRMFTRLGPEPARDRAPHAADHAALRARGPDEVLRRRGGGQAERRADDRGARSRRVRRSAGPPASRRVPATRAPPSRSASAFCGVT